LSKDRYTIVAAVNNDDVLRENLLRSPGIRDHQLILKRGFKSAALAYNSAIDEAESDLIIFVHQDIYLPDSWFPDLRRALSYLEEHDNNWGVLGCFGSTAHDPGGLGRVYTNGLGFHGRELAVPHKVETLDEIILVLRRSSGLKFDPELPHFHWYGTDICFAARESGRESYVFQGLCVHNTQQLIHLPDEFFLGHRYIKKKWARYLPITAACVTITRLDLDVKKRRIQKFLDGLLGIRRPAKHRTTDPTLVLAGMPHES
jgi:hypothetical protein